MTQKETYRETLANLVAKQNDDVSIVSAGKELEALSTFLVPRMLYRYRPPTEYAFADLENATVTFSHPRVFSDQRDSVPIYNWNGIDEIESYLNDDEQALEIINQIDFRRLAFVLGALGVPLNRVRIDEFEMLSDEGRVSLFRSAVKNLRLFVGGFIAPVHQNNCRNCCRILCLTDNPSDSNMWNVYSENQAGFVLAYDREAICNCNIANGMRTEILPILYDDKPFNCDPEIAWTAARMLGLNVGSDDMLSDLRAIYRKGSAFEWENEFRGCLVPEPDELEMNYVQRPCKPLRVILGSRMTQEDRERCIFAANKLDIPVDEQ
ncbi:DUF2971 domain-containing protein [Collinsella sp. AM18-10]|uniref:DUF2971 domain-containing protein n=1 Tax=Collinsella sp. AM18-10 TaxID=2292028 RepID=UPI001314D211|nr:DUF2971 domain-containing protein [Collinsella sp. AM18-10]